jgi:hypothetical protein
LSILLQKGADPNLSTSNLTPLQTAICFDSSYHVFTLLFTVGNASILNGDIEELFITHKSFPIIHLFFTQPTPKYNIQDILRNSMYLNNDDYILLIKLLRDENVYLSRFLELAVYRSFTVDMLKSPVFSGLPVSKQALVFAITHSSLDVVEYLIGFVRLVDIELLDLAISIEPKHYDQIQRLQLLFKFYPNSISVCFISLFRNQSITTANRQSIAELLLSLGANTHDLPKSQINFIVHLSLCEPTFQLFCTIYSKSMTTSLFFGRFRKNMIKALATRSLLNLLGAREVPRLGLCSVSKLSRDMIRMLALYIK